MKRDRLFWFDLVISSLLVLGCRSGKRWVDAPISVEASSSGVRLFEQEERAAPPPGPPVPYQRLGSSRGGPEPTDAPGERPLLVLEGQPGPENAPPDATLLGVFRNTYYDFPSETDFVDAKVSLMGTECRPIEQVPRSFYEAVCVQGSGMLASGVTVSFAKRDCSCAEVCPRTGQKICFDALDRAEFPWGRGALGKPITPLRTVAVDSQVIPLGTHLYIAEFDGIPRGPDGAPHDGCFVAEDRGLRVVGDHIDIFAGHPKMTAHLNQLIPSNRGVHVYTNTARCHGP